MRREYGKSEQRSSLPIKATFHEYAWISKGAESNVPRLRDAGVLFAAGTDAVYPGDFQGEGLHHELELLVESGLSPLEAITVATKNAAAIVNASKEWGTLNPASWPMWILVEGKPAPEGLASTHNVATVIKEGSRSSTGLALRLDHSHIPDYAESGTSMAEVW